jgi:NitT/TauT family transport system substrate-binding protein
MRGLAARQSFAVMEDCMGSRHVCGVGFAVAVLWAISAPAGAAPKQDFKLGWSSGVSAMPWGWANDHGIVKLWADKFHLKIDVVQFNDDTEALNQYIGGAVDAVPITNLTALQSPASAIDSTAIIIADYSAGSEAIVLKGQSDLKAISGQRVNLVQFSAAHYVLDRALSSIGLEERDVTIVNTPPADLVAAYGKPGAGAVAAGNPLLLPLLQPQDAHDVFDSRKLPGEILDLTVINTKTLDDTPDFGKALAGIWYQTMAVLSASTPDGQAARADMAKAAGMDPAALAAQLNMLHMFYTPKDAAAFAKSDDLPDAMQRVREFLFKLGLLGDDGKIREALGVQFPDTSVIGNKHKIRLRLPSYFMDYAASLH